MESGEWEWEVAMGIYARVRYALSLEGDIRLIAANDPLGRALQDAELKGKRWKSY